MRNQITNPLTLMTGLFVNLFWLNFISSAAADNVGNPDWTRMAFRMADDTDPDPLSSFILSLDPGVFKNATEVGNKILENCSMLAKTTLDSFDDQSVYPEELKNYPGGILRTQASAYQTFENYHLGEIPGSNILDCIGDTLSPYLETTPIVDWDVPMQIVFSLGVILATACIAGCVYSACKKSSNNNGEQQRLFTPANDEGTPGGYNTNTPTPINDQKREDQPPSYDTVVSMV